MSPGAIRKRRVAAAAGVLSAALASGALAASTDFVEPATSPETVGGGPVGLVAADFDRDGDRDLATANNFTSTVTFLRNGGNGNLTEPAFSPEFIGASPTALAAADLDGDLDQDLAVTAGGGVVNVLLNAGNGNFTQPVTSPEPVGANPQAIVAADVDGDGDRDLATANFNSSDVTILRNNGNANFNQPASSPELVGPNPLSLAIADLDGDGDRDLVVGNSSNAVNILRNSGSGNFSQPLSSPEATAGLPGSIAPADLDGDGDQDLAVANNTAGNVTILRNGGNANFVEPASSPEDAGGAPTAVVAADLDADGDRDLANANFTTGDVTILRNGGNANFVEPATSPETASNSPGSLVASDLDGDGDPDLATADEPGSTVTILRNR